MKSEEEWSPYVLTMLYSHQMQQLPHAATPSPAPPVPLPALRIRQARAIDAATIGRLTAEVRMCEEEEERFAATQPGACLALQASEQLPPPHRAPATHAGLAWSDGERGLAWGLCTASHSHSHRKSALPLAFVRPSSLQLLHSYKTSLGLRTPVPHLRPLAGPPLRRPGRSCG